MTVEESEDAFPVGMRVLAVDDDPTCLKLLEYLLRLCKYHVTTTNQAIVALKLLRENKNKFDLVISDVHMPDMDGFKLLELVGLEMDLPVIMLSANSETKTVMKGIAHGACDYLLKPVRIEELKNIWQHVIRKRKVDSKDYNNFDQGYDSDKLHNGTVEGGQVPSMNDTANQGGKLNRKRKDQNEDEDEDCEENGHDNEDPSTQKRPRVVWSVELHRKFVAAVNQLGVDKAVPKKILDLMNVEKLTRENVASHLQKYRLYLKRIAASQHANLVATLGGKDSTYLPMASLDGVGDFHSLAGSGQLPDASPSSFQANGVLGRLNCSTGLDFRGVNSSGIFQLSHTHTSGNSSINDLGKLQQATFPVNLHGSLLHGLPISLELDRSHKNKSLPCLNELSAAIDDPTVRPLVQKQLSGSSGFVDTGVTTNYSSHSFGNVSNNPLMLQAQQQQRQCRGLGNQSSVRVEELKQEPFTISVGNATCLPDRGRYNETLQSAVPLTGYSTNSLPLGVPLTHSDLSPSNTRDDLSSITSHIERNPFDASPRNVVAAHLDDLVTRRDLQCQARSVAANMPCVSRDIDENSKFVDFERINNSAGQTMNYDSKKWEDHKQNYANNPNLIFAYSVNSSVPSHGIVDPLGQHLGQNNAIRNRKMDVTLIGQSDFSAPFLMQHSEVGNSTTDNWMKLKEECVLQEAKLQGGFSANSCTPFDDLMNAMIKLEREEATFMGGDIGCDVYPLRTCK